jgi:uncharacterized protein (DUF433 family)
MDRVEVNPEVMGGKPVIQGTRVTVEVILRMRQMMFDMRRQFDEILDDLAQEFQDRLKRGG